MKKKIICVLCALLMLLPLAFCGCAENPADTTAAQTGEPATTVSADTGPVVVDNLPEVTFKDYEFRILGQGGSGWNASDILRPEAMNEEDLNDAILLRYMQVEERFGMKNIVTELVSNVGTTVQTAILSNDRSFDLIDMDTGNTCSAAINNLLVDLSKSEYINLKQPYYDQNYIADMSVGGRLFSAVTDMGTIDMHCTWILMYNKRILANNDLEDPYDLVQKNEWTIDVFNEMLKGVSVDNGDNKWDGSDNYGLGAHVGSARNFFYATGLRICDMDDTQHPVVVIANNDKINLVTDTVTDILYSDNKTLLGGPIVEGFEEGRILFLAEIIGYLGRFREMADDFGLVPYPKLNKEQERYYTTNDPCIMVFSIPAFAYGEGELDRTDIIFEALCCASYHTVRPMYYENVLGGKQTRDYQSFEMLNLVKESRVYDFGLFNDIGTISSLFSNLCSSKSPNLASGIKSGLKTASKKLQKIVEKYDSIE